MDFSFEGPFLGNRLFPKERGEKMKISPPVYMNSLSLPRKKELGEITDQGFRT